MDPIEAEMHREPAAAGPGDHEVIVTVVVPEKRSEWGDDVVEPTHTKVYRFEVDPDDAIKFLQEASGVSGQMINKPELKEG